MVVGYRADSKNEYHLSVVGILVNENGDIGCHYFKHKKWRGANLICENVYLLPSETVEEGETLTEAVLRGAEEECNAFCTVQQFLGSFCFSASAAWGDFEKSLAYFVLKVRVLAVHRSNEKGAVLKFFCLSDLIDRMESQREHGSPIGVDGLE
jgi:ADP-ribose pyrophosphatase YjhB (NUDIX family)